MKAIWILVSLFYFTQTWSANDPSYFEEKSDVLAENTASMLSELKQKAIIHWAENTLKDQFSLYEKLFTPEFCEKFISDYKVNRNAQTKALEISGHLDIKALRRWLQLEEAKGKGIKEQSIQLVFSSQVTDLSITSSDLGSVPFLVYLATQVQQLASKYRLRNFAPVVLASPPKSKSEINSLRSRLTSPLVLWVHFKPGKGQKIIEADEIWYLTPQSRILKANSEDLNFGNQHYRTNKDKSVLKNLNQTIANDFEDIISSNAVASSPFFLQIEGLDSLKKQTELQALLETKDYMGNFRLAQKNKSGIMFETVSSLPVEALAARLKDDLIEWPNVSVTAQDAKTVVIRYSK